MPLSPVHDASADTDASHRSVDTLSLLYVHRSSTTSTVHFARDSIPAITATFASTAAASTSTAAAARIKETAGSNDLHQTEVESEHVVAYDLPGQGYQGLLTPTPSSTARQ